MNGQYTPLLVYCYAIGLPPLASRTEQHTELFSRLKVQGTYRGQVHPMQRQALQLPQIFTFQHLSSVPSLSPTPGEV
jgi:hypothetical protein